MAAEDEPRRSAVRVEAIGTVLLCVILLGGYVTWRVTRKPPTGSEIVRPAFPMDGAADAELLPVVENSTSPLPSAIPRNRVAIRVKTPDGKSVSVASVSRITVMTERSVPWMMGPPPKIVQRFADDWFYVDEAMYRLAQPGRQTDITFTAATGAAAAATAPFPDSTRKIEYTLPALLEQLSTSPSSIPADVQPDEVAGVVLDAQGKPVAGAKVSFPFDYPPEWNFAPPEPPPVVTAADGVFRFPDFGQKHFIYMRVEKEGLATRRIADVPVGRPFAVRVDGDTRIRGDLTRADGSPAANAVITLVTNRPTRRRQMGDMIRDMTMTVTADDRGHYDTPIEPGIYSVRVDSPAGDVAYTPSVTVKAAEAMALPSALSAGETLTLKLVDSLTGKPVPKANVHIEESRPGLLMTRKGSERVADDAGNVTWEHLPAMRLQFAIAAEGYERVWLAAEPPERYRSERFSVDLAELKSSAAAAPIVAEVKMEPAVSVTGQVVAPDGTPVRGAFVDIAGLQNHGMQYMKQTDSEGRFALTCPVVDPQRGMPDPGGAPPKYSIIAFDPSGHWANQVSEQFEAKPGGQHEFTLKMNKGGRVTGRVIDAQGQPVAGIEVEAEANDGLDGQFYNPRQITDADGQFDLGPMRPAMYQLLADIGFGMNHANVPENAVTATVTVAEGETLEGINVTHNGPPPPPVPPNYFNQMGNRRIAK